MGRRWEPREMRLVAEWTAREFPRDLALFRVRLGQPLHVALPPDAPRGARAVGGSFRRWADAIVVQPDLVHLIEAKILPTVGALEQLDLYAELFPLTPEFQRVKDRPLLRHLVWVIPDPVVEMLARKRDIEVHVYRPAWVEEYLRELAPRKLEPTPAGGLEVAPPPEAEEE